MNVNPRDESRDFPIGWIKERLRALAAVEPPTALREKLLAGIPPSAGATPQPRRIRLWPGTMSWAGLAAAVLMIGAVFWLMPAGRRGQTIIDSNGGAGPVFAADHNSLRPVDTNGCDSNGLY